MAANIKPKAWNLKPQMTAAPELWRGLRVLVPFWEGSGQAGAFIDGVLRYFTVEQGSPEWRFSNAGRTRYYDGTAFDRGGVSGSTVDGAEELTIFAYYIPGAVDNQDEGIWGTWDSVSGTPLVHLVSKSGGTTFSRRPRFFVNDGTTAIFAEGEEGQLEIDKKAFVVGSWSSKDDGKARVYYNGDLAGTSPDSITSTLPSGFDVWTIASYFDDGTRKLQGDFMLCGQYDRKLTEEEIKRLSNDPFAMLRPAGF